MARPSLKINRIRPSLPSPSIARQRPLYQSGYLYLLQELIFTGLKSPSPHFALIPLQP